MFVSLYDNQEAMERSYLLLGLLAWLAGFPFLALLFIYTSLQVEDEERAIEEQLLDAGEPTINYALNVQRDIAASYFNAKGTLYGEDEERNIHFVEKYVTEDYLWENQMLAEIYEIPASTIISNSYYLVPVSEDPQYFSFLQEALNLLRVNSRQQKFLLKLRDLRTQRRFSRPHRNFSFYQSWLPKSANEEFQKRQWQHLFLGIFPYLRDDPSLPAVPLSKKKKAKPHGKIRTKR